VVYGNGLENRRGATLRGFESLSLCFPNTKRPANGEPFCLRYVNQYPFVVEVEDDAVLEVAELSAAPLVSGVAEVLPPLDAPDWLPEFAPDPAPFADVEGAVVGTTLLTVTLVELPPELPAPVWGVATGVFSMIRVRVVVVLRVTVLVVPGFWTIMVFVTGVGFTTIVAGAGPGAGVPGTTTVVL